MVLILVYLRVIKETGRYAQERQQAIDKAGEMMQETVKDIELRLNGIAKRNMIGFSIMGACAAVMLFANRASVRKFARNITKEQER